MIIRLLPSALLACAALVPTVYAQTYPAKPVKGRTRC